MTIALITVDGGGTLGTYTGASSSRILAALSPIGDLRPDLVREAAHDLHRYPRLSRRLVRHVCDRLLINPDDWPDPWPHAGVEPYPETSAGLRQLAQIAPVVVVSNMACTHLARVQALREHHGADLAHIYTSCTLRARKPERRVWQAIAADWHITPADVVHIGNDLATDGHGALHAGARYLHLHRDTNTEPPALPAGPQRAAAISQLTQAAAAIHRWHPADPHSTDPHNTQHTATQTGEAEAP